MIELNGSPTPALAGSPALDAVINHISDAILIINDSWQITYINQHAEQIIAKPRHQIIAQPFFTVFPESRDSQFEHTYRRVKASGQAEAFEASFGPEHDWYWVSVFMLDSEHLCIAFHESSHKRRLEIVSSSQREALSVALAGGEQEAVLNILLEAVEQHAGNAITAAICLVNEHTQRLEHGSAPNMPGALKALYADPTVEVSGPCDDCVRLRESVMLSNLAESNAWPEFSQAAQAQGYNAFWCTPILSTEDKSALGTFSLYYKGARAPLEADRQVVDALSRTAAIIIERNNENRARLRAENALFENTETLAKQRRLYETALSNTPDLIYIFDLDGRFAYANDALLQMWGRTWDDSVGKTCLELGYEPWHAEMHMREIRQVIRTKKPIRGDVPFTGTHGRRIYDYIFVPVIGEDGNVEAIAGSTRDVTERHEAEDMAKKAEARRRLALEASHSFGIWDWDINKDIFTADERLGELFNLAPEEAEQGVPVQQAFQYIHPDDLSRINTAVDHSIKQGQRFDQEFRILQQDGSIRWASFRGRVLYDDNDKPSRFPGVGVDVTRERNAIDALQQADQRKDEFLATLAHELRNPLAPIRNSLHIVQSETFSAAQKREAFRLVERQVTQMIRLVDDLMDVSRITRGKIRLSKAPVNICSVLSAAIETVQPLIDECGHQLTVNYPDSPLFIDGDLIRLSQIFSNIINNAAKYTPSGGCITVQVTATDSQVSIGVQDNGIGIPADKLDNIFDMFSQVEGVLERSQGGLGIGLTLVKRLTELHDGRIEVASSGREQGTLFTVSFPRVESDCEATTVHSPVSSASTNQGSPLHVLIADDNQDAAITMGWILEARGCTVKVVEDGPAALAAVESFSPDLVLLDIGMPGMNGYDLCIALRQKPALQQAIFVAQTGWGQPSHVQRSRDSGFHHHLVKPLDMNDLTPILAQARQVKGQG